MLFLTGRDMLLKLVGIPNMTTTHVWPRRTAYYGCNSLSWSVGTLAGIVSGHTACGCKLMLLTAPASRMAAAPNLGSITEKSLGYRSAGPADSRSVGRTFLEHWFLGDIPGLLLSYRLIYHNIYRIQTPWRNIVSYLSVSHRSISSYAFLLRRTPATQRRPSVRAAFA